MQKQKISKGELAYYKTRARQTKIKTFLRNWAIIGIGAQRCYDLACKMVGLIS